MLSCRKSGGPALKRCWKHRTTACRPYSSKVRAFPFAISKEEAIEELSWNASLFAGEKVIGSWFRRNFPSLNVTGLRPSRVQAVYLPTWIVDAEIEATVWFKKLATDSESIKETCQVQFTHSDLPGFIFPPLSSVSLVLPKLLIAETVPWSEDLRRNDEDEVLCLPFSLTPFSLVNEARSMSLANASVADVLRFDPSSVKALMTAAYPVLIPIYVAQFPVETKIDGEFKTGTVSAFIEAAYTQSRVVVEVLPEVIDFFKMVDFPVPDLMIRGQHAQMMRHFVHLRSLLAGNASLNHIRRIVRWIEKAGNPSQLLPAYRDRYFGKTEHEAARAVDWNDVRIRPFTKDEREANLQWLSTGEDVFLMKQTIAMHERNRHGVEKQQEGPAPLAADSDMQSAQKHLKTMEKKREEQKPEWLAQYEIQQRLLVETPSSSV